MFDPNQVRFSAPQERCSPESQRWPNSVCPRSTTVEHAQFGHQEVFFSPATQGSVVRKLCPAFVDLLKWSFPSCNSTGVVYADAWGEDDHGKSRIRENTAPECKDLSEQERQLGTI